MAEALCSRQNLALIVTEKHIESVRGFFYHLMVFVVVNAVLVNVDLRTTGDAAVLGLDWAYWLILFWGLGLAGHAISGSSTTTG